jgi:YD repeat-containing protein
MPGAPAGSYSLSGFENVNLFNGNLNLHMPLVSINGRGGAAMTSVLAIDTKRWNIKHTQVNDPNTGLPMDIYTPTPVWWTPNAGYGPGVLVARRSGANPNQTCGIERFIYQQTLTRVTFIGPDGTEYEFRDKNTGGEPQAVSNPCGSGFNRGAEFITGDGSAATFVSDAALVDQLQSKNPSTYFPSGYLMFRDGTRYRIDSSHVTWIRDRNGNKLSFTYDGNGRVATITDSLNRQITYTYADMSTTFSDQITFKGFGGATRTISVNFAQLSTALRTTNPRGEAASRYQIGSTNSLFPGLNGNNVAYNPYVVSAVTLPNGQQYQFFYNCYAELARVNLPTGGAMEYDYTQNAGTYSDGFDVQVYRRVIERRVYSDGTTLQNYTTYSNQDPFTDAVQTDTKNASDILLTREKHYFHGYAPNTLWLDGISYPSYDEGREYKTELFDTNGTTVLKRVENLWDQVVPPGFWNSTMANNPRVKETTITLEPATVNLVSKQIFGYDDSVRFNNQNSVKEYDFGNGTPGALLRETRTLYVTSSTYTDSPVHLRSLASEVSIWDGAGVRRAYSVNEFDHYAVDTNHAALTNRSSISGFDSSFGTSYTTRGNVTAVTHHILNDSGTSTGLLATYSQYDIAGNVVKAIDARGYATTVDYSDHFGAPDGDAQANSTPTELSTAGQVSYAFGTLVTNALSHTTRAQFDYYIGKPVDA